MSTTLQVSIQHVHNAACETAAQANCKCFCLGAGHQNDLVVRASSCANTADFGALRDNLKKVFGGFHQSERDVLTPTRGARNVPSPREIPSLRLTVGKGATWYETLLVDEALHSAFIEVALTSMSSTNSVRHAQQTFVEAITQAAISVIRQPGSHGPVSNITESHVWCSIIAEYLSTLSSAPAPQQMFGAICYPRQSASRTPSSLSAARSAGIAHVAASYAAAQSIPPVQRLALLRLVGAATCPDLWHHASAVRFSLYPFVSAANWAPANTTKIATIVNFDDIRIRWARRRHW